MSLVATKGMHLAHLLLASSYRYLVTTYVLSSVCTGGVPSQQLLLALLHRQRRIYGVMSISSRPHACQHDKLLFPSQPMRLIGDGRGGGHL